jgi:hypothetical protein
MWDPQHLTTLQASIACYCNSFTLLLFIPFRRLVKPMAIVWLEELDKKNNIDSIGTQTTCILACNSASTICLPDS